MTDAFVDLSAAVTARVRLATPLVVGLEWGTRHQVSAILWGDGLAVSTEQSLPEMDAYTAILPGGQKLRAVPAGRDPGTNIVALRLDVPAPPGGTQAAPQKGTRATQLDVGGMVLAIGSDCEGGVRASMGMIQTLGPAWQSQCGGRIDRLIRLDLLLPREAEGGPVLDAHGALLGMSTFGPGNQILVIPAATIDRVAAQLAVDGRVARGWLGVGVQPVMLPRDIEDGAGSGLMVLSIADGAPAEGKLVQGDILLAAGSVALTSPRALISLLTADLIGATLEVRLLRGGAIVRTHVEIVARPA